MTQSEPAKTHFIYTISKEKHLNTKYKVVCVCMCVCADICFQRCWSERCETDRGFAPGSFQFGGVCSVAGADVAAARGYSVVSLVRLGKINYACLLWSEQLLYSAVWCGDRESESTDTVEDVTPAACERVLSWPAAELCPTLISTVDAFEVLTPKKKKKKKRKEKKAQMKPRLTCAKPITSNELWVFALQIRDDKNSGRKNQPGKISRSA